MKFKKILKKALVYRIVTTIVSFLFLWIVTKDLRKAILGALGIELINHTIIYVVFEYFWNRRKK